MNKYNDSHCMDLTPKQAIENIEAEARNKAIDKKAYDLKGVIKHMISLAGFDLASGIEIIHRRTGKKYK